MVVQELNFESTCEIAGLFQVMKSLKLVVQLISFNICQKHGDFWNISVLLLDFSEILFDKPKPELFFLCDFTLFSL